MSQGGWKRGCVVVLVQVRLFGDVAALAGRSELSLSLPDDSDLRELLTVLDRECGRPVSSALLFDEQTILPSIAMLVNGSNVLLGGGLRTRLNDGDRVAVMPLISGGR